MIEDHLRSLFYSLIVVRPTTEFQAWIARESPDGAHCKSELEFSRLSSAWIVPALGSLTKMTEEEYVRALKPRLVRAEIARWGLDVQNAPKMSDVDLCDHLLVLDLRSYPSLLEPLTD